MCAEDWHFQYTLCMITLSVILHVLLKLHHLRQDAQTLYCYVLILCYFLISAVTVTVRWRISGSNSETVI